VAGVTIATAPLPTTPDVAAAPPGEVRRNRLWPVLIVLAGVTYFLLPLAATFWWSLRAVRDELSFRAYQLILSDPVAIRAFTESVVNAVAAIFVSLLIIVPTAYWVTLRVPKMRPVIEFITLLPFVIPAVVLVFGLIRLYSRPPLLFTSTYGSTRVLLICAYAALSFPYMYRSVDNGLRAIDVRSLTEAAQSLGASWRTIIGRVIFPNLRVALLSGSLLTFAIVIGELTVALYMGQHTFAPYMSDLVRQKVYEPAALTIVAFGITWAAMGGISFATRSRNRIKR
jgi:putative spermidine/putrescine transport system permease protein